MTCEKLNLAGNWMEEVGARCMARMLTENDYITDLVLNIFYLFSSESMGIK